MSAPAALWPQGGGNATWPPSMPFRVRLETAAETIDAQGRRTPGWALFRDKTPAAIKAMRGNEVVAAQTAGSRVDTWIVVPWIPGILPTMRVVHGTTIYTIRSVLPDDTQRTAVTLQCESGVSRG